MTTLVGRKAPDFTVSAVLPNGDIAKFNLHQTINHKYGLIFFYPLNFTFVCPSELIALDKRIEEFAARNTEVIAVSIDSQFSHNAYRNTAIKDGGIGPVRFTMAADINHAVAQAYGVEHPTEGIAFRGAFIIDNKGVVRASIVNDLPIGRNVDELLRLIDAIQFVEEHGEVCPAGWTKGKSSMKASPEGVAAFLSQHSDEL